MKESNKSTEQAVLKAAEQAFMLKGYAGARTTEIAKDAGVTHTMLHYYFRTKECLFERIIDEKIEMLTHQILSLFDVNGSMDIVEKVRLTVERHFDVLKENPLLPGFVLNELRTNPARLERWFEKMRRVISGMTINVQRELDEAAAKGEICAISVQLLLTDIVALNIASFSFADVFSRLYALDKDAYFDMRRRENVEVIMKRLKK